MPNVVVVSGRIGNDPILQHKGNGTKVLSLRLAVNGAGDRQADGTYATGWFDVFATNRVAETAAQYLVKGQEVVVTGRLRYHAWQDQNGQNRTRIYVFASQIDFGRRPGEGGNGQNGNGQAGNGTRGGTQRNTQQAAPTAQPPAQSQPPTGEAFDPGFDPGLDAGEEDDDPVPF